MKKLVQYVAGTAAMLVAAEYLYGTPLYHWMVFVPIFLGTMYGVAVLQHLVHWRARASWRSKGDTVR